MATLKIPDGYTSEEVFNTAEEVITMLSEKFRFGLNDPNDMRQQCWLFILEGLSRFDPNRNASLKTFLVMLLRSRLISYKRDHWYRPEPKTKDKERLKKWRDRNEAKRSLAKPYPIEEMKGNSHERISPDNLVESISNAEIFDIVDRRLPAELRRDFHMLLDGVKLNRIRKLRLISTIKEILDVGD